MLAPAVFTAELALWIAKQQQLWLLCALFVVKVEEGRSG
jgi:hypothetical protein